MRILVLASEVPATAGMPGSPRLFSFCRELSKRHQLTLLTASGSPERYQQLLDDPASKGVFERTVLLPSPPTPTWLGRQIHRLRREASVSTRSRTPGFFAEQSARVSATLRDSRFDVVFVDGLPVSQYLQRATLDVPAIIDLHDCVTLLLRRTMKRQSRWLSRLSTYSEALSVARLERSLSRVFSTIITNSSVDEAYLRTLDPSANTLTIGNGVDSDFFASDGSALALHRLAFTGVMNYGPNEDAAVHFAEDVLPLVQRTHPEVEFAVVGKDPPPRVRGLGQRRGVKITGGVPDVRPYVQAAGIFVCPLRYGTGVKNKLLAALAMRRAVVASPLSLEGLDLRDGVELLVADGAADFAAKVARLIDDPALADRLGRNGEAAVRHRYSWESNAKELETVLGSTAAKRSAT